MSEDIFSKRCSSCNINPAMLFFKIVDENNQTKEEGLCPQCTLQKFSQKDPIGLAIENNNIIQTINEMRHILTDIVGHINKVSQQNTTPTPIPTASHCRSCGLDFSKLKKKGLANCSVCYQEYSEFIKTILQFNNFSIKHHGIIPSRYRKEYIKTVELEKLTIKLQALLRSEQYEEAAKVNKRITKLKNSQIHF